MCLLTGLTATECTPPPLNGISLTNSSLVASTIPTAPAAAEDNSVAPSAVSATRGTVLPIFPVRASRDNPPPEPHAVIRRPLGPAASPLRVRSSTPPLHSTGKLFIGLGSL